MNEKITGYILLTVGIGIILISALNIFMVVTGQAKPFQIFNFPAIGLDLNSALGLPTKGATSQLVSASMINDTTNLLAQIFIVGFFVNVGYKIASLGIELLRPVVVKLREEKQ